MTTTKTNKKLLGFGVICWSRPERRTNRYGSILLGSQIYEGVRVCDVRKDVDLHESLLGKKVRITCEVVENRPSGHIGDLFLKIFPSQPEVGEVIDLGVGVLVRDDDISSPEGVPTAVVLRPGDERKMLWMDPHKLYRLHDQTVNVYIEETDDDFSPVPDVKGTSDKGAVSTGEGGDIQTKNIPEDNLRILSEVKKIGDGMFTLTSPDMTKKGSRLKTNKD